MMKTMNNISLLTILALATSLMACQRTLDPRETPGAEPGGTHKVVLQARLAEPGGTKVAIDESNSGNFAWSAGDQIAVHSSDGNYHVLPLMDGAGTANALFEGELSGDQDFYAVYPASARVDAHYGDGTLQVTLPASYTISGSMGTASPIPMIAVNSGNALSFKYLCGMYRLSLDDVPSGTNQITVTFDKDVTGTFTVTNPGTDAPYIATTAGSTGRTVTFNLSSALAAETDGFVLNVPVPTGTYEENIKVVATGGTMFQAKIPNPRAIARATGRQISKALSVPFGGPFTYNDTEYYISQGNMYKTADGYDLYPNWTGGLDQFGNNERKPKPNQAATGNGYFTWIHLAGLFDSRTGGDAPSESNINDINNGKTPIPGCKLPTQAQWEAFTTTTGESRPGSTVNGVANCRYAFIQLTGYTNNNISNPVGLLLIPDNATLTGMAKTFTWNTNSTSGNTGVTVAELTEYLAKGCVFLPAAGFSEYTYNDWEFGGRSGHYWSASSYDIDHAYNLCFDSGYLAPDNYNWESRYYLSVRLLQE